MNSGWYMNIGVYGQSFVNINTVEGTTVEGSWVKNMDIMAILRDM